MGLPYVWVLMAPKLHVKQVLDIRKMAVLHATAWNLSRCCSQHFGGPITWDAVLCHNSSAQYHSWMLELVLAAIAHAKQESVDAQHSSVFTGGKRASSLDLNPLDCFKGVHQCSACVQTNSFAFEIKYKQ